MKRQLIDRLQEVSIGFDATSVKRKSERLKDLENATFRMNSELIRLHDLLLFLLAHPSSEQESKRVEKVLSKITSYLKNQKAKIPEDLTNSGLPFTPIVTQFSHDFLEWVSKHPHCEYVFDFSYHGETTPGKLVKNALPILERLDIDESANWEELFDQLGVKEKNRKNFLISLFSSLNDRPPLKDFFFDSLFLYTTLYPKRENFSRAYNRIKIPTRFYHTEILKKYDFIGILNTSLPTKRNLNSIERMDVVDCLKNTMALTARETDPTTFMEPETMKLFDLERGISVAIYSMNTLRQLPFETYFGFTLFKNGLPAAYGGAWVFGKRARFGINIFEPYRGGESGMVMSQILRVYRQIFGIDFIEIEAYQFGQDNPDGIKSGAYWFYYKHGFRSIDKDLKLLAEYEKKKMISRTGYRSNEKTLLRFTESNMALMLTPETPPDVTELNAIIRNNINSRFQSNRTLALRTALISLQNIIPSILESNESRHVACEWALLIQAKDFFEKKNTDPSYINVEEIIQLRISNLYEYQQKMGNIISLVVGNKKNRKIR